MFGAQTPHSEIRSDFPCVSCQRLRDKNIQMDDTGCFVQTVAIVFGSGVYAGRCRVRWDGLLMEQPHHKVREPPHFSKPLRRCLETDWVGSADTDSRFVEKESGPLGVFNSWP